MIGPVTTVIVEASDAWPVVAAGLGSASIVALITLWVARKQRGADSKRLVEQLAHDRTMREQELREASERLDRQLAQDRDIREQQRHAESERLDRQLAHDRDMRDLQHLRETLAPIVARALDWDAFTSLHKGLATVGDRPVDEWKDVIAPLANEVAAVNERLRRDSRTLVIIAGPTAPVAGSLKEVANDGDVLVHLTRQRAGGLITAPEAQQALQALFTKYGHDHARFIEAANEAVRWGETEPSVG
jgi:hypothetical protein